MDERYDAVVVGARCAGSALATLLARSGRRVLVLDRDRFPSDTVSTHMMFPDTLDRLDDLGVLERLAAAHRLRPVQFSWRVLGHEVAGGFTPVAGRDRGLCVRRIVLDAAMADAAAAAGAEVRFGQEVAGLLGSGTADDPVRGVRLGTGEQIESRWVFGADGRVSTVARRLGLGETQEKRGEMAFLLGYWRGLPASDWCHIDVQKDAALMSVPCEDDLHLLSLAGPPEITRGPADARDRRYRDGLRQFPAVLNSRLLDTARQVSPLVVVPETMLRGHHREATGPGWALVGDAGLFTHPATAQGIGDAVQQARYLADALAAGDDLDGYAQWRDRRVEEHDGWSFDLARFASPRAEALYSGLAADPVAGQEFLDTFTKARRPSQVVTPQRLARWNAAGAYDDARRRVRSLVQDLDDTALAATVPACPDWTVRDLLAHLAGVAEDSARGAFFPGALEAWRDDDLAAERERWTAGHVAGRAGTELPRLMRDLDDHGGRLVAVLRRDPGPDAAADAGWLASAPAADIAVHLLDLHEALGVEPDDAAASASFGFAVYRTWLHARIAQRGLPALRLSDGRREWVLGDGAPAATVTAGRGELFRAISGRRSAGQIRAYAWEGDPAPYLPVVAPYPLPPTRAVAVTPSPRGEI